MSSGAELDVGVDAPGVEGFELARTGVSDIGEEPVGVSVFARTGWRGPDEVEREPSSERISDEVSVLGSDVSN